MLKTGFLHAVRAYLSGSCPMEPARQALGGEFVEIVLPVLALTAAEVEQIVPAIDAGRVHIVEHETHVIADGIDLKDLVLRGASSSSAFPPGARLAEHAPASQLRQRQEAVRCELAPPRTACRPQQLAHATAMKSSHAPPALLLASATKGRCCSPLLGPRLADEAAPADEPTEIGRRWIMIGADALDTARRRPRRRRDGRGHRADGDRRRRGALIEIDARPAPPLGGDARGAPALRRVRGADEAPRTGAPRSARARAARLPTRSSAELHARTTPPR